MNCGVRVGRSVHFEIMCAMGVGIYAGWLESEALSKIYHDALSSAEIVRRQEGCSLKERPPELVFADI